METPHFSVENSGTSLRFVMPCKKRWLEIIFTSAGFIALFVILPLFFSVLFKDMGDNAVDNLFYLHLLVSVLFALISVIYLLIQWLWFVVDKEIAEIGPDAIIIRHQIWGIGPIKKWDASVINGVFVSRFKSNWLDEYLYFKDFGIRNFKRGQVALNTGRNFFGGVKTARFGQVLSEDEAREIVRLILQRFPHYKYHPRNDSGC